MPAPLAKGLIIAASVIVAAGIAIYESPQVRQWVDQSRRKIAVALHSLGDEIQPRRASESSQDFEHRKKEEVIRQNRNELIRRAREEGVAVDLDELARIGKEDLHMAELRGRAKTHTSQRSFDDLVGSDGKLRKSEDSAAHTVTGIKAGDSNATRRRVLFDRDEEEAHSPKEFTYEESRESSATVQGGGDQLIDLTPESVYLPAQQQVPLNHSHTLPVPQSDAGENDTTQSFYSFTSEQSQELAPIPPHDESDAEVLSAGTLTPRSEHSDFTGASIVGSQADDIAVLSMQNDDDHDARSEIFSEGGFTEAGFSEAGFSDVGDRRAGILTPSSWTDVGSDDESEWGGAQGHVSQVHQ